MPGWTKNKIVVKDFHISFKPLGDPESRHMDLSVPVSDQAREEAIYVAVTGRPAGLFNFLREHIGLPRRFEFLLTSSQCIQRIGSLSTQMLSVAQLDGLNTVTVGVYRPLKQAILFAISSLFLMSSAIYSLNSPNLESLLGSVRNSPQIEEARQAPIESEIPYSANPQANPYQTENQGGESNPNSISLFQAIKLALSFLSIVVASAMPIWAIITLSMFFLIYALYKMFAEKFNVITLTEGGQEVIGFVVSPSLLENQNTDISLTDLNKIPLIFRVLKKNFS